MLFRNATFTPTEKINKEIPEKTESFTKPLTEEILTEEITEFEKPQNEVISLGIKFIRNLPDLIPYRKGDKWGFCDKDKKYLHCAQV